MLWGIFNSIPPKANREFPTRPTSVFISQLDRFRFGCMCFSGNNSAKFAHQFYSCCAAIITTHIDSRNHLPNGEFCSFNCIALCHYKFLLYSCILSIRSPIANIEFILNFRFLSSLLSAFCNFILSPLWWAMVSLWMAQIALWLEKVCWTMAIESCGDSQIIDSSWVAIWISFSIDSEIFTGTAS